MDSSQGMCSSYLQDGKDLLCTHFRQHRAQLTSKTKLTISIPPTSLKFFLFACAEFLDVIQCFSKFLQYDNMAIDTITRKFTATKERLQNMLSTIGSAISIEAHTLGEDLTHKLCVQLPALALFDFLLKQAFFCAAYAAFSNVEVALSQPVFFVFHIVHSQATKACLQATTAPPSVVQHNFSLFYTWTNLAGNICHMAIVYFAHA